MDDFKDYFLRQNYLKIAKLGNKLGELRDIIDWERFRPIVSVMYSDNKETGGRLHADEILMIKMFVLAGWYNLSDNEICPVICVGSGPVSMTGTILQYPMDNRYDTPQRDRMLIKRDFSSPFQYHVI